MKMWQCKLRRKKRRHVNEVQCNMLLIASQLSLELHIYMYIGPLFICINVYNIYKYICINYAITQRKWLFIHNIQLAKHQTKTS